MNKTIENALLALDRLFETLSREEMEKIIDKVDNLENETSALCGCFFTNLFPLQQTHPNIRPLTPFQHFLFRILCDDL